VSDVLSAVRTALARVAPEADLDTLSPDDDLQEVLDLDSMDFLNLMIALHDTTGVDVPERDYPEVRTLRSCVEYLEARSA
jgi:acyl carrier protein